MKTIASLAAVAFATALHGQSFFFSAPLSGANERPTPNASTALGFASVTFDFNDPLNLSDDTLSYSVSYSGMSAPVTAAHIHGPATTATTAGVIVGLTGTLGATTGSFAVADLVLSPALSAALQAALFTQDAGVSRAYVNIHTTALPGGELRGQLVQVAAVPEVESTAVVAGMLGLGALVWRRRRQA